MHIVGMTGDGVNDAPALKKADAGIAVTGVVTAIMIVLLALFNDAPIMAIAYDNVRYSNLPEKCIMRIVLGIATLLRILGVLSSFFIFYIGHTRDLRKLNKELNALNRSQTFILRKIYYQ